MYVHACTCTCICTSDVASRVVCSYQKVIINDNLMVRLDHRDSWSAKVKLAVPVSAHCWGTSTVLGGKMGINQLKMISASPLL